jgi:beta-lactamase regulating signal transducer with metallopeptidase domain
MEMTALVWILTYAIHSTVLIVAVWVVTKVFHKMSLSSQEALWKAAFLGGLATATLQLAAGATPPWGHFSLPAQLDTQPVVVTTEPAAPAEVEPVIERRIVKHDAGDLTITTIQDAKSAAAPAAVVTRTTPLPPSPWPWVLLGLVGLGSAFALVRLGLSARRLAARLRARRDVIEDPVLEAFLSLCQKAELGEKKRLRLTASPHLRSPLALWSREIVLPERALERLTPQQQESMVAHELAHIVRRDPHWSVLTAVVEALFFFQPLNHLARRKIRDVAEFQCDDWAARVTGTGVHLAKCLAEVAAWIEDGEATSAIAVSMADDGSPIVRRITRLLHGKRARARESGSHAMFGVRVGSTIGLLGLTAWLVPGVSRAAHEGERPATSDGAAGPAAYAAAMSAVPTDRDRGDIVVRELGGEGGKKRSQVRIERDDEVVRVEVERAPAPPPPPPVPENDGGGISIRIHGGVVDPFGFPFGEGFGWLDMDVEVDDDFDLDVEGMFGCGWGCVRRDWHDHLEEALEHAERERERALRSAERERERARERQPARAGSLIPI